MAYEKVKTETYELLGGINTKVSQYVNGPEEFRDLSNLNFRTPGSLTKRDGTTLYLGATVIGRVTGGIEFERLDGSSYMVVAANTNLYTITSSFNPIRTGLANGALFDFTVFVDRLFAANGTDWFKTDGTNSSFFGLPPGITGGFGATASLGGSLPAGTYLVSYGYRNDIGTLGPASPGVTVVLGTSSFAITYYGMTTPTGFGISNIALYRSVAGNIDMFGTTFVAFSATTAIDPGYPLGVTLAPDSLYFTTAPKYMEIYNNQLMVAGFTSAQSTLYWSEIGQPENIDPAFNAEFRTNDGDRITGLKSYAGSCLVFKNKSFHRYTGDNPSDPLLQEISDQYGAISNRAIVVFENMCWFLDTKGVVQYNGANIDVVSNKIEPIINSMNQSAAADNAWALHVRKYNELWFGIPINGATMINCIIVYDYVAQAWTKYEGLNLSSAWLGKGFLGEKSVIYGGYTGNVFNFGASLTGDNGAGITCLFDSKFYAVSGQTTERMYRRFYLDLAPIFGVTSALTCNFRVNYGTSVLLSETMYQNPFQSRIDFGLSGRAIQAEVSHYSATLPLMINGFTFESRFQRAV